MQLLAITGIGCLLPGESNNPQSLWDHVLAGHDLIVPTPADRWNLAAYYHPDPAVPGRTYLRWGGFVSDPDLFDAGFFGIPPREAVRMDPQQRWLLQTAWEALEDAGCAQQHLAGAKVGVYIGISSADYGDIQKRGRFEVDAYTNSGNALSIASNRISYALDLRGPSLSVDTACSSSLVALDLACQALWRGDIVLAIVGGANSLFTPDLTVGFSKAGMLSPDGRCKSFDASANGYVRSEGAVCVVLKPLTTALADGDRVYAVLRSTYVNQDGRTGGMTVPSFDQQAAMLTEAYRRAGVSPLAVGYVEAHGTGTPVGDPIEALALGRVLGEGRTAERPLWIGSIKSNMGHVEPASGVAGLAKLALALYHRTIPPNVHFHELNPRIPFGQWHMQVPTKAIPWHPQPGEKLLLGGVNSFGFGGTNAHAVLSSVPEQELSYRPSRNGKAAGASLSVWTVSARSKDALKEAARRDAEFLQRPTLGDGAGHGASGLSDFAATVQQRRSHHSHRLAIVAGDAASAGQRLSTWAELEQNGEGIFSGQAEQTAAPVFVFSGQGAQWPGMAQDLFTKEPLFRGVIEDFDQLMRPRWGRSLVEVLQRGDESVFQTDLGQPLFFAIQVGVARMLQHWGIRPACVLGHSIGEVAAAHVCGALTAEAAAWLVVERSLAQEMTRGTGGMAAVGISVEEAEQVLAPHRGFVHIAAVNSPTQLTLAGAVDRIDAIVKELATRAKFARVLGLPYAYHTPAMDMVRGRFMDSVTGLQAQVGSVPYISTVTGATVPGDGLDVEYWWHNLRQPVQFLAAIRHALQLGHALFVEIGPHPALVRYIKEIIGAAGATADAVGTLRRKEDGVLCLRETVAALHVRGLPIDWAHLTDGDNRHRDVPRYPWQKQRFWAEAEDARRVRLDGPQHPLLGTRHSGAGTVWQNDVSSASHPYLQDHGLDGKAVFPAAGFLELLFAAAGAAKCDVTLELNDVRFERVLWIDRPFLIQSTVEERTRRVTVNVRAIGESEWHVHCRAHVGPLQQPEPPSKKGKLPEDLVPISVSALYERFERAGHMYGPAFRALRWAGTKRGEYWGRLTLAPELHADAANYLLHPALLDAAFQLGLCSVPTDQEREAMYLPISVDRARLLRPGGHEAICRIFNVDLQDVRWYVDVELYTPDGEVIASLQRCCCLKKEKSFSLASSQVSFFREMLVEAPAEAPMAEDAAPEWVLLDATGTARQLADKLAPAVGPARYWQLGETELNVEQLLGQGSDFVIWTVGAKQAEPMAQSIFDAVWPIAELARALTQQSATVRSLVLVTAGASDGTCLEQASLSGLFRVLSTELPQVVCKWIDLDAADVGNAGKCCDQVLGELRSKPRQEEIAFRDGQRWSRRLQLQPLEELKRRPLQGPRREGAIYGLQSQAPGSLESLAWVERPEPPQLGDGEVEIAVRAVGLNFRDVLKALDLYPLGPGESRWFGDECAGNILSVGAGVTRFRPGDAVVAIAAGCLGNRVRVHECLVAKKPENLSWAAAATIPIAFLTADYSLRHVARLQPGETVLIHAAAGGVGQAAVQIARSLGATILGTASPEKQDMVRAQGVSHVFNSRDLTFVAGIRAATGGAGVDVVLNSLAGDFIPRSLELLKPLGRFVEIGKKDIFQNECLNLHAFRTAISFAAVDLARVIAERPSWIGQCLQTLLEKFQQGECQPLPQTTYPCQEIHDAFRLMAQGKHRGKVVLTCDDSAPPEEILAANASPVRSGATYLITGGLSGLGLATAQWLVEEGADTLVLMGRRGPTAEVEAMLEKWRGAGVQVRAVRGDVTSLAAVEELVSDIQATMPPLRGVFHSAMVLHDEPLARLTADALVHVLAPKVQGAWNLHQATCKLPLDFFVLYSSVSTLFGSAGQASYVMANRFLDGLAEQRSLSGLASLSVNWGPLAEFGVLADNPSLAHYVETFGLTPMRRADIFSWLKFLLRRRVARAAVMQVDWAKFAQINPKARTSPLFSEVLANRESKEAAGSLRQKLAVAPSGEQTPLLMDWLRNTLARVLGATEQAMDESTPLLALGLDSLMAFEFKLLIDRELGVSFPVDRLMANMRLSQLPDLLLAALHTETGLNGQPVAAAAAATPPPGTSHAASEEDGYLRLVPQSVNGALASPTHVDAAALVYLPEKMHTVGGLSDEQMTALFGREPFLSHCYDTSLGTVGIIMLPVRSNVLFRDGQSLDMILRALDLADSWGAKCVSLTGLIPSATDYGLTIEKARRKKKAEQCLLTTGHATTTAAVVLNLQNMFELTGRCLADEALAVVGLGSIGQSCLRLLLEVLPHPRHLVLCDLFAKQGVLDSVADALRRQHGYRGTLRIVRTQGKVPDEVYDTRTILAAVSVPDILDVARFRPGTILADDSYPPAAKLIDAVQRAENHEDFLFSNVGMLRLPMPIRETVFIPAGAEAFLEKFGKSAFRDEVARDPYELTACVLSSLLTARHEGFEPTLGLAGVLDLVSHYRSLESLGITAAGLQCENYFVPPRLVERFCGCQEKAAACQR